MTRLGQVLSLVACLVFPLRLSAQSTADQIYNHIVALEKRADVYQAQHLQEVAAGRTQLSLSLGVPQETTQAIIDETKDLEALAKNNNVRAKHLAGLLNFFHGESFWPMSDRSDSKKDVVDRNFKAAEGWFLAASRDGYPFSMYMLGVMHANGQGVLRSSADALNWYSKAGRAFVEHGEPGVALLSLEEMNKLDSNHPLTQELSGLLRRKHK